MNEEEYLEKIKHEFEEYTCNTYWLNIIIDIIDDLKEVIAESKQLQNNWNELKKSIEEQINICDGCIDTMQSDLQEIAPRGSGKSYMTGEIFKNKVAKRSFGITLDKMQELEQGKDE